MRITPTGPDFGEEIDAGIALLDRQVPGWLDSIDTGSLKLQSPTSCVLGQLAMTNLYGQLRTQCLSFDYHGAALVLLDGFDQDHTAVYGFNLPTSMTLDEDGDDLPVALTNPVWEALTLQWGEAIEKRRAEAGTLGDA